MGGGPPAPRDKEAGHAGFRGGGAGVGPAKPPEKKDTGMARARPPVAPYLTVPKGCGRISSLPPRLAPPDQLHHFPGLGEATGEQLGEHAFAVHHDVEHAP